MNCGDIKELILTDYMDGEADAGTKALVEGHIGGCAECNALCDEVMGVSRAPFAAVKDIVPPEEIWAGIKADIGSPVEPFQVEKQGLRPKVANDVATGPSLVNRILRRILGAIRMRRPVYTAAVAGALVIALFIVAPFNNNGTESTVDLTEDIEFLVSLGSGTGGFNSPGGGVDIGTSIEEYFL